MFHLITFDKNDKLYFALREEATAHAFPRDTASSLHPNDLLDNRQRRA
jgi:hypothetical protein